ncbi:MAG TPA: D-cysteine desulfhydrase family protein [Rhizobiales bacterium]|nr:D-cysteine desulfhydrase family protein [Hyphomicrobiales bacterium]
MTELSILLGRFPKARLGHHPTPLEPMPNLAKQFVDQKLWVKRDDCNGLAFGGNKVRQLEYYLGEAQSCRADSLLITGAVQSNFVRLAAAAANKLGMQCHVQLENRVSKNTTAYKNSGNVLLDRMLGAEIHYYDQGEDEEGADRQLHDIADQLKKHGRKPYIIHLAPGHRPLGALGYVEAAIELLKQVADRNISFDKIVVPSGSGNTHAGLLFGLRALGDKTPVEGICVRRDAPSQVLRISSRAEQLAELLGTTNPVTDHDINLTDRFLLPAYGQLNPATAQAIKQAAKTESLILDPVYSGKTMAGFLAFAQSMPAPGNILFWHTGGAPAVFAYPDELGN